MLTDKVLDVYIDAKDNYIISSTDKMGSSLEMFGSYSNLDDLMYSRALYFLLQNTDCYTEEVKAFLNSELDKVSISANICSPLKF